MRSVRRRADPALRPPIPSPNIWHRPEVYERENAAQDPDGRDLGRAARGASRGPARDVLDVGCGDGFHLPLFAAEAASVVGVEPYPPLVERARRRVGDRASGWSRRARPRCRCRTRSVDLVHARTAYFFGPGCEPGLAEAQRVLRPGGAIAIVDLDATVAPYGDWMRADIPHYDPVRAERFFAERGSRCSGCRRCGGLPTARPWRRCCASSSPPTVAERAIAAARTGSPSRSATALHVRRRPSGIVPPP